jgi:hypothetical protein
MIKGLFFTAALLVPGPAYGGNPSADLSVQVVPAAPPGSIACAAGQTYPGAVPAPAQAAGLTTCAMYADFTSPTFANIATWPIPLQCGGATTQWVFQANKSNIADNTLCSTGAVTIAPDPDTGDPQVLHLHSTPDQCGGGGVAGGQQCNFGWPATPGTYRSGTSTDPVGLPLGYYVEMTFRAPASTYASLPSGYSFPLAWWGGPSSDPNMPPGVYLEMDYDEMLPSSPPNSGVGNAAFESSSTHILTPNKYTFSYAVTQYHKLGVLITSDYSTTIASCLFLDGRLIGCGSGAPLSTSLYHEHDFISNMTFTNHSPGTSNADVYIKSMSAFSCANYHVTSRFPQPGCPGTVVNHWPFP